MAAPVVHDTNTATVSNNNTKTITLANVAADDIIVLFWTWEKTNASAVWRSISTVSDDGGFSTAWAKRHSFELSTTDATPQRIRMETWWIKATASKNPLTVTVNWTGNANSTDQDDVSIGIMRVTGCNLTSPWDPNASVPSDTNGGSTSVSLVTTAASAISTTNANDLLIGFFGSSGSAPPSAASGWTEKINANNGGGSNFSQAWVQTKEVTATQTTQTVAAAASPQRARWGWVVDALTADSNSATATWDSTEAKDTFAGAGGLLGGAWASTEARDVFAGAGYPQLTGSWASTEAKDLFDGEERPHGTMAVTEAPDVFAGTGPVQVIGTMAVTETKDVFDGSGVPNPIGTMVVTEARDTFAGAGYPRLRGTMAATEAKDVFAGSGIPLLTGSWASTEAKDIFAATGAVPSIGTMDATETPDSFAAAGGPPASLGIDAHATGSGHNTTSASVSITSLYVDDVIVLAIYTGGFFNRAKVSSITDTAGLTWTKRHQRWTLGVNPSMEIWWAKKPSAGATTITVHTATTTGFLCIDALAIRGANANKPWDTNTGAGWFTDNFGSGNPTAKLYSDSTKGMALAFYSSNDTASTGALTAGTGWTWLERVTAAETSGQTGRLESAYKIFDGTQLFNDPIQFGQVGGASNNRDIMQDVIVSKDDPDTAHVATDDLIRWFFDGHGQQTILAMSGTNNSATQTFQTFNAGSIAVVAVMIQSSLGARVDHITDTTGYTWERRSIVTSQSGAVSLEVWWTTLAAAFAGNVTVVADSNIQPGDIIGFCVNGINGPDAVLRGEVWDGDSSLPNTTTASSADYQNTGPFSTLNDHVLEINFVANTGTDPTGFNRAPWLQFIGDFFGSVGGELVSQAPDFNIALDFKFSAAPVDNETVEADVSPKPDLWFMIADAMPVGPPSPPIGSWHSTEAKDTTHNSGAFTAIGLDTSGWVGYVPADATMAPTEPTDRATNNGAFTAIWDTHGWIAYVPAHATMAPTENKDIMLDRAWVLGPTTILARMEVTEDKDRFACSGPATYSSYLTPDSTGDRTSRITVTTNASIASGTPDRLVDGSKANGAGSAIQVNNSQSQAMYFQFDFGSARIITEAKWYQNGTSAQPGVWKWQGSDNASNWTDLSSTFALNAGNGGAVIGDLSANITRYRYYRILQTTNAGGNDIPWLWEIEFKVEGIGGIMAVTEYKDRAAYQGQVIPLAQPLPARKRRLLIVT